MSSPRLSSLPSASSLSSAASPTAAGPSGSTSGGGRAHCAYVLLAEFDIDEGSLLRHQYPAPTGTDEHLLAEHMLPDGAHDRAEDWTVFYLNQIPPLTVKPELLPPELRESVAEVGGGAGAKGKGREAEGLLYVMSLVRTKKDSTVRRGALVKALAIATAHPYIHIYKPLLLLALEEYFSDPGPHVLAKLYNAVNAMDLSLIPSLSYDERTILRSSDRKDLFLEKFAVGLDGKGRPSSLGSQFATGDQSRPASGEVLISPTGSKGSRPSTAQNQNGTGNSRSPSNGSISSLASGTAEPASAEWGTRSRANTLASSSADHPHNRDRTSTPSSGIPFPQQRGSKVAGPKDTHFFESRITYGGLPLPIRVPLGTHPGEIGDYSLISLVQMFGGPAALTPGPLHPHLHTSGAATPSMVLLFNALVTRKRVVILGHGQPAGAVANLVLAACALGSGCGAVLGGFLERAFPYTNLTNLDNLEGVEGFIAGVCNPAFANRPSWWDVLCNMETGKVVVSKDIAPAPAPARSFGTLARGTPSPYPNAGAFDEEFGAKAVGAGGGKIDGKMESADGAFMEEIMGAIQSHYGESVIRARFTDYCARFVRLASRYEEDLLPSPARETSIGWSCLPFAPAGMGRPAQLGAGLVYSDEGALTREIGANAGRIEGWRLTPSYALAQADWQRRREHSPLGSFDFAHQLVRLRQGRKLPSTEVEAIFRTLTLAAATPEGVLAMLAHLPPHFGGLLPLAFGLLHPSDEVRAWALELFDRVSGEETGRRCVEGMNAFVRAALVRLREERAVEVERQ